MSRTFVFMCHLWTVVVQAQPTKQFGFQYDLRPTVSIDGHTLFNPWAGGLNATQYSTMSLNDDKLNDLVVFDRTTNKISTFVAANNPNSGGVTWKYASEHETAFPAVYSWMFLVDYDNDGQKDLFTNGLSGVRLFRNESVNGRLAFRLVSDPIITEGYAGQQPLYVPPSDTPAILDYDDDGDIDVLTFDGTGDQIAYHQNLSIERTGRQDGLNFKRTSSVCWGHFKKNFCNDFTFGLECGGELGMINPNPIITGSSPRARPLHSGNTLTVLDTDGDGNKDLLFGFVSCPNIARISSIGPNNNKARFATFDSLFPARNPIVFPAFPATFWEDVDGDGNKDLLASPNVSANDNQAFDFRASGWFYRNVGTNQKPDFQLVQKDFLQAEMLDLGERAAPALADLDGDGDVDLLIGYAGSGSEKDYRAGLWQFENQGTMQNPAFVLVTTDYLGVAQSLKLTNTVPAFADIDGNGGQDLILNGIVGQSAQLRVFLNTRGANQPAQYTLANAILWPVPELMGPLDLVTVTDVDRDSKPDLLIGRYSFGTILYYQNVGTAIKPIFQLQNQNFGSLPITTGTSVHARSMVVADLNGDQKNEFLLAATDGSIRIYAFPQPVDATLTLIDSLPEMGFVGTDLIAAVADLDGDQLPDIMLGSRSGGLRYLKNTSPKVVVTDVKELPPPVWAFPNPTGHNITIRPARDGYLELISLSGQIVKIVGHVRSSVDSIINLSSFPSGSYVLRLLYANGSTSQQTIVVSK